MDIGFQYQLPSTFIQVKKNEIDEKQQVVGSFICNLYNNYNFELYKNNDGRRKVPPVHMKKPKNYGTQQMKRLKRVKTMMRLATLEEKQLLDSMRKIQYQQKMNQKKRIQKRIIQGKDMLPPTDHTEYVQVVNLQKDLKQLVNNEKKVHYVNLSKMKSIKGNQQKQECIEVDKKGNSQKITPLEKSYNEKKIMYENNKALNEKDTYKFNVNWWQSKQNINNNLTEQKKSGISNDRQDNLDPEAMKNLKRQLKPLRRHKLIGSIHAPLAEFMSVNMHEKDGIKEGKMIDSSESEDDAVLFDHYDNILNKINNPPGLIELEKSKSTKRRNKKKQIEEKIGKPIHHTVNFDLKARILNDSSGEPTVERRLKRALIRMKNTDWQEDKLFTKGMDEDKPIQIDDIQ